MITQIFANAANKRARRLMKSLSGRNIKRQLLQTASVLGLMVGAHTGAMMGFEGMAFGDALWLSLTTATTVGYE